MSRSNAPAASPPLWNAHDDCSRCTGRGTCRAPPRTRRPAAGSRSSASGVRVARTVEHGGAHRAREQRRPHSAELAAVAEPEVGDLLDTERLADRVHVAGGVVRADVLQVSTRSRHRCANSSAVATIAVAFGRIVRGHVEVGEEPVVLGVVDAVHGTFALAGATRIPADDVEVVGDLGVEVAGCVEGQGGAPGARATAIGEHGSDRSRCWRGGGPRRDRSCRPADRRSRPAP